MPRREEFSFARRRPREDRLLCSALVSRVVAARDDSPRLQRSSCCCLACLDRRLENRLPAINTSLLAPSQSSQLNSLSALHTIFVKSALGFRMVSYQYPFTISDWPLGASVLSVGAEGLDSSGLNSTSSVDVSVMDEGVLHVGDDVASG